VQIVEEQKGLAAVILMVTIRTEIRGAVSSNSTGTILDSVAEKRKKLMMMLTMMVVTTMKRIQVPESRERKQRLKPKVEREAKLILVTTWTSSMSDPRLRSRKRMVTRKKTRR
jgi:hypothetical protein